MPDKNTKHDCSIQFADFSFNEHPSISIDEAIKIISDVNWIEERGKFQDLEASDAECCPPNFIVNPEFGVFFQICPINDKVADCALSFDGKPKFFGLWPTTDHSEYSSVPLDGVLSYLELAWREDWLALKKLLKISASAGLVTAE